MVHLRPAIIALFAFIWLVPGLARAHPMLDRAVASYEEANFETALRTFDAAARNADLSVEELLELFEMRALVHHALGDRAAMRADLLRLSAVRPGYQLSRLAPPPVRSAFEEVREEGGVELRIDQKDIDGAPWMLAHVVRVPDGLVDHITLQCRVSHNTKTISRTSQGITTTLKLPKSGDHNGCAATARTRQGGVLFSANVGGSVPLDLPKSGNVFEMPQYKSQSDTPAAKKKWPWIVAVTAVVVGAGIATGVVLSQRSKSSSSQPAAGAVTVSW